MPNDEPLSSTGDFERDAEALLDRFWIYGEGPPAVPVDPIFIARQLGLEVLIAPLEEGVGGMLVNRPGSQPTIYLNSSDGRNRQRFTCAHEIGHWVKRAGARDEDWAFVDKRDQLAGRGVDPSERYANGFAAGLLMPARLLDQYGEFVSPDALAAHFHVSAEAMAYRLRNRWASWRSG